MTEDNGSAELARNARASERQKLDRSLVHGMAWTGASRWATQILSWASTLVIARLLTPADYGVLTMANVYIGFVALVNEFGLGPAIIRQRDLTEEQISALGGVSIGLSVVLWLLSALISIPVAAFFEEPAVRWVITALGFTFVTSGLRVLPRALLTRDLQFKRIASIDATESVAATILTLLFALLGYGYWSLVWSSIIGSLIATFVALRWRPHRRHWPKSFALIGPSLRFGWHLVVARFAWYFYSTADFTVIGRLFGKGSLGGYGFAWTLASIPVTKVSALVNQVTPAIFSAVQNDRPALGRYFLRLSEGLAFITFPFSVGVSLVAEDFVMVALGAEWRPAIVPLQLLAFYAGYRSITTLHPQILQSVGKARNQMQYSLLALAVLPALFYAGGKIGGIAGVAWGWIIGYPLVMIPPYRTVFQATGVTLSRYVAALWPSALGAAGMAAVVLGMRALLPAGMSHVQSLIIEVVVGALTYVALTFGLQRQRIRELIAMFRNLSKS